MAKFSKYELRERAKVLAAYNHCCAACGSPMDLEVDHVHPRNAGGTDTFENLQILCHHCNNRKNGVVGIPKLDPREPLDSCLEILANREIFVSYLDECKRLAR
jgi:5-methylcytosine-specific restriction endonuclease McrA